MTFEVIPTLDRIGLRNFALSVGSVVAVLFGLGFPYIFGFDYPIWPWVLAAVLIVWGLIAPSTLQPVYKIWMGFGQLLHKIVSPVLLGVVFFGVITPFGLLMRLSGRNPLRQTENGESASFRVESAQRDRSHMERPY